MYRNRLLGVLLRPSLFSSTALTIIGLIVLGSANWPYVAEKLLFYDYFFGPDGLVTAIQDSPNGSTAIVDTLLSKSFAYNIAIVLGALAAGAVVFVVLQILSRLIVNAGNVYQDMHAVDSLSKHTVERELGRRIGIRMVILAVWLAYLLVSVKVITPFCVFTVQVGLKALWAWEGYVYLLFGFFMFYLCLHLHVILARLFLLRPRVFGGEDAILGE
jgi:hypothetical protein